MKIANVRAEIKVCDALITHQIIANNKSTDDPYVKQLIEKREVLKKEHPNSLKLPKSK